MADIAKAYVQIVPSAKGLKGSLNQALGGEVDSAGTSAGSSLAAGIKKAIVGAGIGVAAGKVLKDSLEEGAALQQSIGGIETLFGNQGKTIEEYAASAKKSVAEVSAEYGKQAQAEAEMFRNADQAFKTAGLSRNEYMEQVTSFSATLIQGLEGDTMAAAKAADKAMVDMSDNANKFGTDIGSIQNAYQGFAKNNYTMLDNLKLGYGGTAEEMARLINDSGVLGDSMEATAKNVKDIPFDKVIEAIHVTQENLKITGTTSDEAAKTFSGSMQSMQAAAKNVLGSIALGEDISQPLSDLASTVVTFFQNNFLPMLSNVVQAIPGAITTIFSELASGAGGIATTVLDMITGFATAVVDNLPLIITAIENILWNITEAFLEYDWSTTGTDLLNRITESITTGLPHMINMGFLILGKLVEGIMNAIPNIIAAVPAIFGTLMETLTQNMPTMVIQGMNILRSLIDGIVNNLDQIIAAMIQLINISVQTTIDNLPMIIQAGIEILLALISGIIQATPELIAEFFSLGATVTNTLMEVDWMGLGLDIIAGICVGVVNGVSKLVDAVKSAALKALETAKSALGIKSPSDVFRDQVGKMIDLGIAGGIEEYTNPIKNAMNGLSDMTQSSFQTATQLTTSPSYQTAELAPAGMGDLTIPVYIGNQKFSQAVVKANMMNKFRSGGR